METVRLYYENAFTQDFTAVVESCGAVKGGFAVVLDRTAFYPEGGGQPADHGTLGDSRVLDVHEKDGIVTHLCDRALPVGAEVSGHIDWARRFDHMQQHSGEHIVSGMLCSAFHCDNVGFHMGADTVTIDYNADISWEQALDIERRANQYIWEDHPVHIWYPSPAELAALPYRSKKALEGAVRITEFPGADMCACCGTHVDSSGQVGLVKFLSCQKFRDGVRLELLKRINTKRTRTAYANLLDEAFRLMYQKGHDACMNNRASGEAFWKSWTDIMTNLIGFGVYLALLSGLNPWLCVLTALTAVVSYFSTRNINEWGYRHREEGAKITRSLHYLRNTAEGREFGKDIRIFGLRQWLTDLYDSALRLNYAFLEKRERAYLTANLIDLALLLVRNGAAYAYLLWLTVTRGLPVSEFLLYFGAASGFAQWVTGLMEQFALLRKQSLDISTIREFLELPEPFRFEEGIPLEKRLDMPYELQLEDVSYRYPGAEKNTIAHMSLTLHPGENLAIVGLNGAGKTTLVKLICGFLDPTGGRVLLNGQDIRQYNRRDYYKLFEAVFQDFSVLSCTVAENVAQAMDGIDEEKVRYCLDQAGLTEKITSLPAGIKTHVGRDVYLDGVEFSGGQTQRLMLARALYKDAPILVLDEPTAALDPIAEDDIYQKYNEMTRGRTSLFISHRLASPRFCDRILFLENGRVAEEGTHDQLMAQNDGYAKLFAVQSKYYKEGKAV